jgi:hypothetical protein
VLGELKPCVGDDEKWAGVRFDYRKRGTRWEREDLIIGSIFSIVR